MSCETENVFEKTKKYFTRPDNSEKLIGKIHELSKNTGPVNIMEICGTHTMSIAKTGLKSLLPENVRLLSGPGCPVCVTPTGAIANILSLSEDKDIIIASYGDLLKVPAKGSDCLMSRKAKGANVEIVYSPMDAVELAKKCPDKQIVFIGVGFETTAPGTAACISEAALQSLDNFSVLCLLKRTEPALRALISSPGFKVNAFICPGHVAAITGSGAFSFLSDEYGFPAVVSGFDAADLLYSVYILISMLENRRHGLVNEYKRVVSEAGNTAARNLTDKVFYVSDSLWRGLGTVNDGGLEIREEYSDFDARKKFALPKDVNSEPDTCLCAEIIKGNSSPFECPLFGNACTPLHAVGPCMVSSEGSCAAAYKYEL